jgi:hypothetical protein
MKATAFLPVLALAATCAFAQQPNRQPNSVAPSTDPAASQASPAQQGPATDAQIPSNPSNATSTTIHGCLGTGSNNTFTVSDDKSGSVYTLVGKDFGSLSSHVGQEVEADGSSASAVSTGSSASTVNNATTTSATDFQVTHMRKVGDKCATTPKPSSSLETYSPVVMAAVYAPQTAGSTAGAKTAQAGTSTPGAQTAQPGTSTPGNSGAAGTTGMSTSPQTQTATPGQSTPSTAMPTTPPPTSPGTVNDSTPGTQTSPGTSATGSAATGSSNSAATPGTQPPCAATSTTPCSTPGTVPSATPGTSTPQAPPPTATVPNTTAKPNTVTPPQK